MSLQLLQSKQFLFHLNMQRSDQWGQSRRLHSPEVSTRWYCGNVPAPACTWLMSRGMLLMKHVHQLWCMAQQESMHACFPPICPVAISFVLIAHYTRQICAFTFPVCWCWTCFLNLDIDYSICYESYLVCLHTTYRKAPTAELLFFVYIHFTHFCHWLFPTLCMLKHVAETHVSISDATFITVLKEPSFPTPSQTNISQLCAHQQQCRKWSLHAYRSFLLCRRSI